MPSDRAAHRQNSTRFKAVMFWGFFCGVFGGIFMATGCAPASGGGNGAGGAKLDAGTAIPGTGGASIGTGGGAQSSGGAPSTTASGGGPSASGGGGEATGGGAQGSAGAPGTGGGSTGGAPNRTGAGAASPTGSGGAAGTGGVVADAGTTGDGPAGSTGGRIADGGGVAVDATVVVTPPVSDTRSTIPIARPGGQYRTDGNIPYGPLPAQRLDVIYPANAGPNGTQRLPAVLMFHGGGWIQGDKATMSSFYSRFLAHGFIVCTVEYRVANGSATGGIAPAAAEDALLAAKWFWDHLDYYKVDRAKYVVTGASAGGHLALFVGMATAAAQLGPTHGSDFQIAAIVNGYGPADVADLLRRGTGFAVQWLPPNTPNRDALARRLSPVTYVRKDVPPLLTVHGSQDSTTPLAQSQTLDTILKAAGADAALHVVAGAGHGFSTPAGAWPDAEKAIFDFLVKRGIGR